jgi:hypothetical protein
MIEEAKRLRSRPTMELFGHQAVFQDPPIRISASNAYNRSTGCPRSVTSLSVRPVTFLSVIYNCPGGDQCRYVDEANDGFEAVSGHGTEH